MSRGLLLRTIATLATAAVLYFYVDWRELANAVFKVRLGDYLASTLVFLASLGLLALRLKLLLGPTTFRRFRLGALFNIQMSSLFYGFAVPSDIGTAVVRWYQITRNTEGRALIALITVLERLMMLAATTLFAMVALWLSNAGPAAQVRQIALPIFALIFLAVLLAIFLMLTRTLHSAFGRFLDAISNKLNSEFLRRAMASYWRITDFHRIRRAIGPACLVQLMYQGTLVWRFVLLFHALGLTLAVPDITWISMAVLALISIPITIAGLGIRELGFAGLLAYFGVAPEVGVLLGLLAFSQLVLAVVWGGLTALLMRSSPRSNSNDSE